MATARTAHYLDGRSARRHRVTLTISEAALQIAMADGNMKQWPYGQIRQTQGTYSGEPVRLEFGPEPAEAVVVASRALLTEIHAAAPALAYHFHNPAWRNRRLAWTMAAGLGVVLLLIGLYRWGIPGIASAATPYVPAMWEESLGRQIVEHLAPEMQQCRDPDRLRKINEVVQTLAATQPASPYQITLSVVDNPYPTNFGDLSVGNADSYSRAIVTIPVTRPLGALTLKTFVPVLLIILCAGLALIIRPQCVDGRIGLAITALLTLVALQLTGGSGLPDVDYLMMLDKVYLVSYAFIMLVLLRVTSTSWRVDESTRELKVARNDRRMVVLLGLLYLISVAAIGGWSLSLVL